MTTRSPGQKTARQEKRRQAALEARTLLQRLADTDPLRSAACVHCGTAWPYGTDQPPADEHRNRCLWRCTVEWLAAHPPNG